MQDPEAGFVPIALAKTGVLASEYRLDELRRLSLKNGPNRKFPSKAGFSSSGHALEANRMPRLI